jgi:exonuclease V
MKPLSVSDLTAGAWCELQYFYTLTRLPGGRRTRTAAMKRGTGIHETLERQVFTPVQIQVTKKEDTFGLRIWNIIQGLRVLRERGFTRELEVWGMVDGNVVNGVIDSLSYENPDPELQEDVLSSRGSSQVITNSQPYEPSTPGDYAIYIVDVKTRNSATPPPQMQVRSSIIQLFLYHRFLSEMANNRLDYITVFERYGVNPDEPFSDDFMAQIGAVHDEVFVEPEDDGDASPDGGFVSAPSSPSQVSYLSDSSSSPTLRYRSLRTLLTLLKSELRLTFPRGAADLGNIVAVEYRYRGRDPPPPRDPLADAPSTSPEDDSVAPPKYETGSVICVNTFFVEPETLDLYLSETMRWWRGEREPHGVTLEEAGFKCRSCEFREVCEWRRNLDQEAVKKARRKKEKKKEDPEEIEVAGEEVMAKRRRGRPKKARVSTLGDVYA